MGGQWGGVEWCELYTNIIALFFFRKENGDIGERTFEDYDVELINPPMLRLREDLSV